jgi:NAD(P)-dependent dehydrogenase (short-subunit alcohol dehydrogenase family)
MSTSGTPMQGQIVVVTGATQGIGLETARDLARQGARVVITARDRAKADRAIADVTASTGNAAVGSLLVDFSSMESMRQASGELHGRVDRIDVLVNNAGAIYSERQLSRDGLELTFATNHIGYFLFTQLHLDLLQKSSAARVVSVSSDAHKAAVNGVAFDDLERKRGYSGFGVYGESKLMNILFTRELSRRLAGTRVTANCLHPGVIASGFGTNNGGLLGFATRHLSPLFLTTPQKGAATTIYLASSPEIAGTSGQYFAKCRVAKTTKHAVDDAAAKRLWEISEQLTGTSHARGAAA